MSETKYYTFNGTMQYNRLKSPDDYGNYTARLAFDDQSEIDRYNNSGIQVTMSEDNMVYFRRSDQKLIKKELIDFGPPKIVQLIDGQEIPFDGMIGAGSKVALRVRAYPTQKGPGHQLDEVVIKKLVPVENSNSGYYSD